MNHFVKIRRNNIQQLHLYSYCHQLNHLSTHITFGFALNYNTLSSLPT